MTYYFNLSSPRKMVHQRDKGFCACCGLKAFYWEVDHIKPLIEAKGDITYWELPNLRTLCRKCHKGKTAEDTARLRATRAADGPRKRRKRSR